MVDLVNKNVIAIIDSKQVFLAKSILQALIKDIDLENPFHGEKVFVRFLWGNLPEKFG